ncbi:Hypothetical predicted protein [Prunus dulcis]|uniref:Uncharacterized protein n=1 Tax=Prunus dulcis TaxID=3755 RepID=A0A5E4FRL3_PRUDU|nr:hypothetical protein L3X38_044339 [Prunus dulcis]VVA29990.1 Hypothetical predicted protein [Prunus dulcis]
MFLCSNICSRFNELEVGAFEMTYLVPDHPPCVLETDLDVRVMYLSVMNEKKYTVTIAIKEFLFPEKQNGVDDMFCGDGKLVHPIVPIVRKHVHHTEKKVNGRPLTLASQCRMLWNRMLRSFSYSLYDWADDRNVPGNQILNDIRGFGGI